MEKEILYFYPRDNTPGCTQQAIEFTAQQEALTKKNCVILGVSRDTHKSHTALPKNMT